MAGFYDNELGKHINAPEMMNGHWIVHIETGELYILPKDDAPTFDTVGADDEKIDLLNSLCDNTLNDDDILADYGFVACQDWQRRFDEDSGFYAA